MQYCACGIVSQLVYRACMRGTMIMHTDASFWVARPITYNLLPTSAALPARGAKGPIKRRAGRQGATTHGSFKIEKTQYWQLLLNFGNSLNPLNLSTIKNMHSRCTNWCAFPSCYYNTVLDLPSLPTAWIWFSSGDTCPSLISRSPPHHGRPCSRDQGDKSLSVNVIGILSLGSWLRRKFKLYNERCFLLIVQVCQSGRPVIDLSGYPNTLTYETIILVLYFNLAYERVVFLFEAFLLNLSCLFSYARFRW